MPLNTASLLNVLAPAIVCAPVVLTTVLSTSIVPLLKSIPSPPEMYDSTLAFVKYKLSPSVISVVVNASLTVIVSAASSYTTLILPDPDIIEPILSAALSSV